MHFGDLVLTLLLESCYRELKVKHVKNLMVFLCAVLGHIIRKIHHILNFL